MKLKLIDDDSKSAQFKTGNSSIKAELWDWIKTVMIALVFALVINNVLIVNAKVPSGSMMTTIQINDRLFANRLAYDFGDPKRGDIIVFHFPDDETQLFVKRLIGLPGDTVSIKDGTVYVNGTALVEPYVSSPIIDYTKNSGPYVVPAGHYFMMGDNRGNSEDSRYWKNKFVARNKMLGKVFFRYYPNPNIVK